MSDSPLGQGPALLAEAKIDSLLELFSRDPEKLSEIDLTRLVESLREQRVKWAAAEAAPKERKAKAPADRAAGLTSKLSIKDLGL